MSTTTDTAHTPGPWIDDGDHGYINMPDGTPIAQVFDNPGEEESEYNARLIAAAPDMLVALDHALNAIQDLDHKGLWADEQDVIEAAIAKATGGAA